MASLVVATQAPYEDASEHLADWHALVLALLGRWLSRYEHRLYDHQGTRNEAIVSVEEAIGLAQGTLTPTLESLELGRSSAERVCLLRERIASRLDLNARTSSLTLPIEDLRALFGLSDLDLEILLVAAFPQISVEVERLTRFLSDREDGLPTVGFLAEICCDERIDGPTPTHAFFQESPLLRHRLIRLESSGVGSTVVVTPTLLGYLQGCNTEVPTELASSCTMLEPDQVCVPKQLLIDDVTGARLRKALYANHGFVITSGLPSVGRRTVARAWLATRGTAMLEVDLPHLMQLHGANGLLEAQREARLRDAVLLLRGDGFLDDDAALNEHGHALREAFRQMSQLTLITVSRIDAGLRQIVGCAVEIDFPPTSPADQRRAWADITGCSDTAAELAGRFQLSAGMIYRCAAAADNTSIQALTSASRRAMVHSLDSLADPIETRLDWDDVVFSGDIEVKVKEIIGHAKHREQVFDEWGFGDKLSYGRGLSCLFSGAPGTGKTMMAGLVAKTLGLELWRVDVSRLVSKWIGETEKNLAKVFEQARRAQVVLLFDEADSLFGKRTEVRGANDRHANMEVNFLLQKMESHDGVAILTTNRLKDIDEAFLRRIRFRVDFPVPENDERAQLWRRMIPARAPTTDNIDFDALGEVFTLSGGHIRNAVLRASFLAATNGGPIDQENLFDAAVAEAREMGQLVRS